MNITQEGEEQSKIPKNSTLWMPYEDYLQLKKLKENVFKTKNNEHKNRSNKSKRK